MDNTSFPSAVVLRSESQDAREKAAAEFVFSNNNNEVKKHRDQLAEAEGNVSPIVTCVNLFKCAVGAGSFSLPYAYAQGGFWSGIVSTLILGALAAHTACLLFSAEKIAAAANDGRRFTYPELPEVLLPGTGGKVLRWVCLVGVVVTSLGVSGVYIVFCASQLTSEVDALSQTEWALCTIPLVWLLAQLRSFRYLGFTSILGDVAVVAGLVACVAVGFSENVLTPLPDLPSTDVSFLPQSMSSVAFLFLVHVLILPIAQSLRDSPDSGVLTNKNNGSAYTALIDEDGADEALPRGGRTARCGPSHAPFPRVAWTTYGTIATVNAVFGGLCVALFDDVEGNVIDSLPHGSAMLTVVRSLLVVDLVFTLPIVLAAGREIVEGLLLLTAFGERYPETTRIAVRTTLVGLVYAVALAVPNFNDLVNLVGGLANCLMGLILPPVLWYLSTEMRRRTQRRGGRDSGAKALLSSVEEGGEEEEVEDGCSASSGQPSVLALLFNGAISLFGLVLLVWSTYLTIEDIVQRED